MVTVSKVFAAVEALAPADRLELSDLLRSPNGRFPLVPGEIAQLPVPLDRRRQAMLLDLVDRAVRKQLDSGLSNWTLGQIIPCLARLPGGVDTAPATTNRLNALAYASGSASWVAMAGYRVADIRAWRGAGLALTTQLVGLAVRAGLDHLAPQCEPSHQGALFDERRTARALALDRVLHALDDRRERVIFEQLDLRLDTTAPTQRRTTAIQLSPPAVAELVGLSYERCRQLRAQARAIVRNAAASEPVVAAAVVEVIRRLGDASPLCGVDDVVRSLAIGGIDDPAALLAVWLAGPYLPVRGRRGWLSPRPTELLSETRHMLGDSGGVHDHRSLVDDLTHAGVDPRFVDGWLAAQPVRVDGGLVVLLSGSPAAIAERVLESTGRSTSTADLQAWMPDTSSKVALPAELRRMSRFVETAPDLWELADWGGEPSDHHVRLEVDVTEAVLSGDGGDAPRELATLLGLQPGTPKKFPTRFGPLSVSYDGERVKRGSTRPIALACGAMLGDTLVFIIDPRRETAAVESVACAGQAMSEVAV